MSSKGCYMIQMFLILILLLISASTQESQCASSQSSQPADAQSESAAEQKLWDAIKNRADPQEYKTFLAKHPQGRFEGEARSRLSALIGGDYVT